MLAHVPGVRSLLVLILILGFNAASAEAAGWSMEHRLTYSPGDFRLDETVAGWQIRSASGGQLGRPGVPALPMETLRLVLPQGMELRDVQLRSEDWRPLVDGQAITQREILASEGGPGADVADRFGFAGARQAQRVVMAGGQATLAGYSIGGVEILPVRETAEGNLEYLASATLQIELAVSVNRGHRREVQWPEQIERDRQRVRSMVANPQDVERHAPAPGIAPAQLQERRPGSPAARTERSEARPIDLLILTSEEMRASFQPLADRREAEGLASVIVSMDEVFATATPGADQQETIRNYLRDAWSRWGVSYVLLGGDAELIAPRYARSTYYPTDGYTDVPSDLYYSAYDGTWNGDGNGIPGQPTDDVDVLAEVSLGRVPVDTPAEATAFIAKLFAYEEPANPQYLGRALFLSEVLFPDDWIPGDPRPISLDGAAYSEDLIFDQIIGGGNLMQSWRLYQNYTAYTGAVPETKTASLDSMNTGHFGLVNHIGHGFYYNMSVGDANIFADDANTLTNPNPFFIHALNCSSGAFDVDSLLERYLQNTGGGAIGSAGSSRAAFPFWASLYQTAFFDEVFVLKNLRIGDAQKSARERFSISATWEGGHRWTHLSYHLFGDPTMRLAVAEPRSAVVTHSNSIPLGSTSLTVSASASGGVLGAVVALSDGQGQLASAAFDAGGSAVIDLTGLSGEAGSLTLVVSGANLLRHEATVDVVPSGTGHLRAQALTLDDSANAPSVGDNDGEVDSGETLQWGFRFSNDGGGGAVSGASATLVPVDAPGATILVDNVVLGNIVDGAFEEPAPFVVQLDPTIDDGSLMRFVVQISSGGDTWTDTAELIVRSPILRVARLIVDDSAQGNGDGIADAGELFDLLIEVVNRGEADLIGLTATLSSAAPPVSISDASASWPDLAPDATGDNSADVFAMGELDVATENMSQIVFSDTQGHQWTHDFELRAPAAPGDPEPDTSLGPDVIALRMPDVVEPHFAGYRVYRRPAGGSQFEQLTQEPSILTGLLVDSGLPELTRFEYQVTLVDSSAVESAPTGVVSASTAPGELLPGFPIAISRELGGALAVGDVRGDNSKVVAFGADWIYALDASGNELVDGDGDAQTLGPLGGDAANLRWSPSGVALADLDGDGADEIIGSNWNSRQVLVLRADGSTFPGWPQTMNGQSWATPSVGDLDNDGDLEIVVNNVAGRTYVWHHDGTDFFDADSDAGTVGVFHIRSGENFMRSTAALFDVDGDDTLEIIFGTHYRGGIGDNFVHALRNDGTDAPGWPKNMGLTGYTVGHATVGDLNQDGTAEIILLTENNQLNVWEPDGSNYGTAPYAVTSNAAAKDSRAPAAALADFDLDGDLEMVVISILDVDECEVMIMEHDGTLWPGWPRTLEGLSESSPVLGDLDGDASIDILFGIGGGSEGSPEAIYAMAADGSDIAGFPISVAGAVKAVPVIDDFDLDGDVDVIYAGYDRLVHVWDMPFPYNKPLTPWSTFQSDNQRTGVYSAPVATAVLSASIDLSATVGGIRIFAQFDGALPRDLRFSVQRSPAGAEDWVELQAGLKVSDNALIFVDGSTRAGASYDYRLLSAGGSMEFRSQSITVPALKAAIESAVPNPFNPRTAINFVVPATAGASVPTRLEVFDIKGRLVRQLHVGPLAPGPHTLVWDGVDGRGRAVGSGVYLAVLSCAGERRSLKMSLVK